MRKFPALKVLRVALTAVGTGAWLLAIAPLAFVCMSSAALLRTLAGRRRAHRTQP